MLGLSRFTLVVLGGGSILVGALVIALYRWDQGNHQVLVWGDFAEILGSWGVMFIMLPAIEWSVGIGARFGRQKSLLSILSALFLSMFVGLYGVVAFYGLAFGVAYSTSLLADHHMFQSFAWRPMAITFAWAVAAAWFFTLIAYFENAESTASNSGS